MKMLFLLLHMLLCQWVVAFDNTDGNVGIENVGDADGKVFLAFASDKLPFTFETIWGPVNHTYAAFSCISLSDKTNIKIGATFGNDAHFPVKTPGDREGSVDTIFLVAGEPVVLKVNLCPWPCLSNPGHGQRDKSKYEKQPFHAAKIEKN